jgi:hypothetical protein
METLKLSPQFIKSEDGKPIGVFLTIHEFESILQTLKDIADYKPVTETELNTMSLAYAEKSFSEGWEVSPAEDEYWNSFTTQHHV